MPFCKRPKSSFVKKKNLHIYKYVENVSKITTTLKIQFRQSDTLKNNIFLN